jgi:hypothetical protein
MSLDSSQEISMKTIATAAVCTCLVFGAGVVSAQSASMPMGKQAAKITQDCKDRVTTQKGEKRNDSPAEAETDKACADAPMKARHHMKKHHVKKDKSTTSDMSASSPS